MTKYTKYRITGPDGGDVIAEGRRPLTEKQLSILREEGWIVEEIVDLVIKPINISDDVLAAIGSIAAATPAVSPAPRSGHRGPPPRRRKFSRHLGGNSHKGKGRKR